MLSDALEAPLELVLELLLELILEKEGGKVFEVSGLADSCSKFGSPQTSRLP